MTLTTRPWDVVAVGVYLAGMIAWGWISARRSRSSENYFVGRRNFPDWVVALSLLGTIVSSTTFLALPAAAYVLDWRQLTVNLVVPFVAILAAVFFIPFFRRAGLTSAFEYLGDRFGAAARLYGTIGFIFLQLIRVAQVLFLIALPLQFLTGADLEWVIAAVGMFVLVYTVAGGMETVVWAGVIQASIMLVGGVVCLLSVVSQLPGGLSEVIAVGSQHDKFSLGSFTWDPHQRTFYTVLILGLLNWLNIYSGEQTVVQRYVSARSLADARRATLLFSAIAVPMWTMFFFIGTALFVYFKVLPDPAIAGMQADQILPYFVLTHVPAGLAGLVIAAVIAAAMSSLDSGLNSISTVVVVDLLKPYLAPGREDRFYLRSARTVTAMATVAMISGACFFANIEKESMNDVSLIVFSVFGGAITGLYLIGFFSRRVDGRSANMALALSIAFNVYLGFGLLGWLPNGWSIDVHSYWIGALVNLLFIVLACVISWIRRVPAQALPGLTVWTMGPKQDT